ncbi:unnamed protein product, partial [marine sediment metagenome]
APYDTNNDVRYGNTNDERVRSWRMNNVVPAEPILDNVPVTSAMGKGLEKI